MITPTRFALLIGILIFSSLFMSTFLWSMQSTWSWIQGTNNQFQWDVTYAGQGELNIGINFFIPIADGLSHLNILMD